MHNKSEELHQLPYHGPVESAEVSVQPEKIAKLKRFAIAPAPFDNVMTYEEAVAQADKMVLDNKARKIYVLEIVGVIEPITRMVDFTE